MPAPLAAAGLSSPETHVACVPGAAALSIPLLEQLEEHSCANVDANQPDFRLVVDKGLGAGVGVGVGV